MTDQELGEELKALGMDAASWRSLPLLPLVQVAWADGEVQDAERDLILHLAADRYHLEQEGQRLLRNWLHHAPSLAYVRRGQKVLVALVNRNLVLGAPTPNLLADVVGLAQDVARAAGGFFGYGSIAAEEAEAIDEIAKALDIDHDRAWITPEDATMIPADADADKDGPPLEVQFHADGPPVRSRASLVQFDELRGEQSVAIPDEGVTLGRNRDNTVQITFDPKVSRRHCRIYGENGKYYVQDLGSIAGTWVNGERVIERRLLGGETLHVGAVAFFFQLSPEDPVKV